MIFKIVYKQNHFQMGIKKKQVELFEMKWKQIVSFRQARTPEEDEEK